MTSPSCTAGTLACEVSTERQETLTPGGGLGTTSGPPNHCYNPSKQTKPPRSSVAGPVAGIPVLPHVVHIAEQAVLIGAL